MPFFCFLSTICRVTRPKLYIMTASTSVYHHQSLLQLRNQPLSLLPNELRELGLLKSTVLREPAGRKRCARRRKRGKRGSLRAMVMANPRRPAVPSLLLSNVCSLENKLDYLRVQRATQGEFRDCCVFVFTETRMTSSTLFSSLRPAVLPCGQRR